MNDIRKGKSELSTSMHTLIHSSAVECGWGVTSRLKFLLCSLTCGDGWYPGTLSYNKNLSPGSCFCQGILPHQQEMKPGWGALCPFSRWGGWEQASHHWRGCLFGPLLCKIGHLFTQSLQVSLCSPIPTAYFHTTYTLFGLNHCQIHRTAHFVVLHKGWVYWVTWMWLLLKLTARRLNEPCGTVEMLTQLASHGLASNGNVPLNASFRKFFYILCIVWEIFPCLKTKKNSHNPAPIFTHTFHIHREFLWI